MKKLPTTITLAAFLGSCIPAMAQQPPPARPSPPARADAQLVEIDLPGARIAYYLPKVPQLFNAQLGGKALERASKFKAGDRVRLSFGTPEPGSDALLVLDMRKRRGFWGYAWRVLVYPLVALFAIAFLLECLDTAGGCVG